VYAVHEFTDCAQRHRVLAKAGENSLDVRHERSGRTDHQHSTALEPPTVGVQQVGRTVQCDDSFAGTRAAADHSDTASWCPDRLVLLGLDGRDDVAHRVPASARQRRHQRALAEHRQVFRRPLGRQQVVFEPDDPRPLVPQYATAYHAQPVGRGRSVERLGGGRSPVDHQRLVLRVTDADPADVQLLQLLGGRDGLAVVTCVGVEPAEHQSFVLCVQLGDPAGGGVDQHVALVEAGLLLVADPPDVLRLTALVPFDRDPGGGPGGLVDPGVDPVDVCLLCVQLSPFDIFQIGRCGGLIHRGPLYCRAIYPTWNT
jgi:hypothetical protein